MAEILRYVDPNAAAAGDGTTNALSGGNCAYVSLNAWEAATQQDLTDAGGDTARVVCSSDDAGATHAADTTACAIDGWTTGASNYITIKAASSHGGKRNATIYRLETTTAWVNALEIKEDYVRCDGLQLKCSGANTQNALHINAAGGATSSIRITNSLAYNARLVGFNAYNGVHYFNNCIAMACGGDGFALASGASSTGYFYNCGSVNNAGLGFSVAQFKTMNAKNCYSGGNTGADFGGSGTLNKTTCHAEDGTGDTTTAFSTSSGAYFTNVTSGSEDLSIAASSALADAGTDLSGDGSWINPNGNVDIISVAWGTWAVGAFEYAAAGGSAIPVLMHHYLHNMGR